MLAAFLTFGILAVLWALWAMLNYRDKGPFVVEPSDRDNT